MHRVCVLAQLVYTAPQQAETNAPLSAAAQRMEPGMKTSVHELAAEFQNLIRKTLI